jgi:uncharacterized protein involved in outer membrane biogenesis
MVARGERELHRGPRGCDSKWGLPAGDEGDKVVPGVHPSASRRFEPSPSFVDIEKPVSGNATGSKVARWLGRAALAAVGLALVLAGLVALVVPGVLRSRATRGMEAATGRTLAIGAIDVNPFTWRLELREVSLSEPGGKGTFASFRSGRVVVSPSSLWRGAPIISQVRLESPRFNVVRTGPNTYNLSDLIKYLTLPIPPLSLNDVRITGGTIDFLDLALGREERHTVRDGELLVPFLTTIPYLANEYGTPRFSALVDGAPLVIEGRIRGLPRVAEATAEVDLKNLSLPTYLSYLPAEIPVLVESGKVSVQGTLSYRVAANADPEVAWNGIVAVTEVKARDREGPLRVDVGEVAVRSRLTLAEKTGMLLEGGTLEVRNFSVPFGARDGMTVGLLSIQGSRYTAKENRIDVAGVLLENGSIRISRDRKGVFSYMALLEHLERRFTRGRQASAEPVRWRVGKIEGKGIDVAFTDGTRKELPGLAVSGLGFLAEDVRGPIAGPMAFSFSARFATDTAVRASGSFVPTPLSADVDLEVHDLALAVGGPYLPAELDVVIADGRLDLKAAVSIATRQDRLSGTFGGSASLRSLKLLDRRRGKLLAWKNLSVDGVKGSLAPLSLQIGKVGLSGLRAELVVEQDGTLNLPRRLDAAPDAPGKPEPARKPGSGGLQAIRVDELVVKDGAALFVDRSVPGEFRGSVDDLDLRVTGLSSVRDKVADVHMQAVLQKTAHLRIAGKASPLWKRAFADLEVTLERLDLSTATAYSGAYLGLEIDRGDLTVKSRARVDEGKLSAENRIRVDRLTFGQAVKSDKATFLPVQLLADILRDKNGDIVLDLPLSASTDDENLVGTLVGQAVNDVIFPPGSPLRSIHFAGCSAELAPGEQEKLKKLAAALQERPAMKIEAVGFVDRDRDLRGCPSGASGTPAPQAASDDERLRALAAGRGAAVRAFLVEQAKANPEKVLQGTRDIYRAPIQAGDPASRVEFEMARQ